MRLRRECLKKDEFTVKLVSLILCRNESWVLEQSLRASLRWTDEAIVLDHASTDATDELLRGLQKELPGRIHVIHEPDPEFREMHYRHRLLETGRSVGASHMAILDADEMLTENLVPTIRQHAEILQPGEIMQPPWIMLWRSPSQYRQDGSIWSKANVSFIFRDSPDLHWTTREIGGAKEYHLHHRHCHGSRVAPASIDRSSGGVLHLQHVNWDRLLWKQLHYRLMELARWPEFGVLAINSRYGPTTDETDAKFRQLPDAWRPPELTQVNFSAEPWHKDECRRLVAQYGRDYFDGIDFLGLDL